MFPHGDSNYAALKVERVLAIKRAERLAPLREAAEQIRFAPASVRAGPVIARGSHLARARLPTLAISLPSGERRPRASP